jgi:ubiquitin carboxyl-terminal hydrolase L5
LSGYYLVCKSGWHLLEGEVETRPNHSQTISNACASIALLNIVMNIRGIDLGPTLEQLRSFSMPLTPALRGYVVGNHDYLRKIHNSFSR